MADLGSGYRGPTYNRNRYYNNTQNESWTREGFLNWKNGVTKIIIHETSETHIKASIKAMYKEASFPLLPSIIEQNRYL